MLLVPAQLVNSAHSYLPGRRLKTWRRTDEKFWNSNKYIGQFPISGCLGMVQNILIWWEELLREKLGLPKEGIFCILLCDSLLLWQRPTFAIVATLLDFPTSFLELLSSPAPPSSHSLQALTKVSSSLTVVSSSLTIVLSSLTVVSFSLTIEPNFLPVEVSSPPPLTPSSLTAVQCPPHSSCYFRPFSESQGLFYSQFVQQVFRCSSTSS